MGPRGGCPGEVATLFAWGGFDAFRQDFVDAFGGTFSRGHRHWALRERFAFRLEDRHFAGQGR